jgi:hypothetical protein
MFAGTQHGTNRRAARGTPKCIMGNLARNEQGRRALSATGLAPARASFTPRMHRGAAPNFSRAPAAAPDPGSTALKFSK